MKNPPQKIKNYAKERNKTNNKAEKEIKIYSFVLQIPKFCIQKK